MYEDLIKIINEWDPVNLLPLSPDDEYREEVLEIIEIITNSKNLNVDNLACKIRELFLKFFGENIFKSSFDECRSIAEKILSSTTASKLNDIQY